MRLLTVKFKFPEMERFPAESRESVLRQCLESTEMQRLRSRWGKYPGLSLVAVGGVLVIVGKLLHEPRVVIVLAATVGAVVSCAAVSAMKLAVEYRLIRRLLKHELHEKEG